MKGWNTEKDRLISLLNKRTNTEWKYIIKGKGMDRIHIFTDGITELRGRDSDALHDETFKLLKAHGNSRVWRPYL